MVMHYHTKFDYKRLSGPEDITKQNPDTLTEEQRDTVIPTHTPLPQLLMEEYKKKSEGKSGLGDKACLGRS